jgi:hypothetical protein
MPRHDGNTRRDTRTRRRASALRRTTTPPATRTVRERVTPVETPPVAEPEPPAPSLDRPIPATAGERVAVPCVDCSAPTTAGRRCSPCHARHLRGQRATGQGPT